jgi:DNA-binding CsgD family transcriptional regulator
VKKAHDEVFELFMELGATDEQLDFTTVYAIGREGIAKRKLSDDSKDLTPLLDVVLEQVPVASGKEAEPFQAQVFNLGYDTFMGRLAICRIYQGSVSVNQNVIVKNVDGTSRSARLTKIFSFDGVTKKEVTTATAGDIVLVAGIADAVLVIEASQKSGALITSRLATEYNRDVLAVPGPITWPTSFGTNMLLRLGATPITSKDDLREALGFPRLDEQNKTPTEERDDLSAEEKEFLLLLNEPKSRDELLRELGLSVSDFNMLLTMLEIKGIIKEELGMIRIV